MGPDLTNLAKRSEYRSILESIITPNLIVSDQFQQHAFETTNGLVVTGRIVSEENGVVSVIQNGLEADKFTKIKVSDIDSKQASKLSMMPSGTIDTMNAEEVKDLLAYFISQGSSRHAVYRKAKSK